MEASEYDVDLEKLLHLEILILIAISFPKHKLYISDLLKLKFSFIYSKMVYNYYFLSDTMQFEILTSCLTS